MKNRIKWVSICLTGILEGETRKNREEIKVKEIMIYSFSDFMKIVNPPV